MNGAIVRFLSVELFFFKNVEHGKVAFPGLLSRDYFANQAEIVGIYGQNGSGKTALIDALLFLQRLLQGNSLREDAADYIFKQASEATLQFSFSVEQGETRLLADYRFTILQKPDGKFALSRERLSYTDCSKQSRQNKVCFLDFSRDREDVLFLPKSKWNEAVRSGKDHSVRLRVAKILSEKERTSFVFCQEGLSVLRESFRDDSCRLVLDALHGFACHHFFVIKNDPLSTNRIRFLLPMISPEEEQTHGDMLIDLSAPAVLKKQDCSVLSQMLAGMNRVLCAVVPGLTVELVNYGPQLLPSGEEGIKLELVSSRGETKIPLKYESEGIKKILSVLNILIAMYNKRSVCLVVDELDAGVYEYLLGELLSILEQSGKGQLFFTSHNLRPLEMLDPMALVFTTTNPQNRYIRLSPNRTSRNLRDSYLRGIHLGGQKECIYEPTNRFEISRAFRIAGRDLEHEED